MKILPLLICVSLLGSVTLGSPVQAAPAAQMGHADVASRVHALNALLAERWQHTLKNSPEFATILGDLRYNDRWSDASLAQHAVKHKATADFLKRFEAIDTRGFSDTDFGKCFNGSANTLSMPVGFPILPICTTTFSSRYFGGIILSRMPWRANVVTCSSSFGTAFRRAR